MSNDQLVAQTKQHLLDALAEGGWHPEKELHSAIPAELAAAQLTHENEMVIQDMCPEDQRLHARRKLFTQAIKALAAEDQVETDTDFDGKKMVRLDPSAVTAAKKNSMAKGTPAVTSPTVVALKTASTDTVAISATDQPPSRPTATPPPPAAPVVSPFDDEPALNAVVADSTVVPDKVIVPMPVSEPQPRQIDAASFGNALVRLVDPDLPIHELANLFPETGQDDYQRMKDGMRANGQQVAAWLYEGKILDGRTRQKIAREAGLKLAVQDWQGPGDPLAFVVSLNLDRRHLNESQRAMVAAKMKSIFEEQAKQRMLAGVAADPMAGLPQGTARDQAGKMLNVSPRSVESASKTRKKGHAALVEAVEKGELSVSAAADLTKLPPSEQQRVVQGGKATIKAGLKKVRQQKAAKRGQQPKSQPSRKEPAKPAKSASGASSDTDSADMLTIRKPATAAERNTVANLLWDRWGREECQALALVWTTKATKDKPSEKPKPGAKVKPGQKPKPAAKGDPDSKTQPGPKAKPPVKARRSGPVIRPGYGRRR